MTLDNTIGARFATWWVEALTRTAERGTALDRRAEIASDLHEQLTEAQRHDVVPAVSRSVIGRVLRGIPSDIAWRVGLELRRSRFAWHLRNPSTAITTLFVAMIPLNVAADSNEAAESAGTRSWPLLDYQVPLWAVTQLVGGCILLFALLALSTRVSRRWPASAEQFEAHSRLERARRCATAALGVALAGSAVFRFGALSLVGGVFWGAFVACLLLYVALLVVTFSARLLTLGRYLPKVRA
jgi:hypothetical protein